MTRSLTARDTRGKKERTDKRGTDGIKEARVCNSQLEEARI